MAGVLDRLYPERVWFYFESICAIPHGSGHTAKIANYLTFFAKMHGLSCVRDKANNVIGHLLLSVGGTDSTTLDVKLIAKGAVDVLASKVILSHNHPSGNPLPGATDISMTNKIREALAILDIELLDHVIICDGKGYSFNTQSVFIIK